MGTFMKVSELVYIMKKVNSHCLGNSNDNAH